MNKKFYLIYCRRGRDDFMTWNLLNLLQTKKPSNGNLARRVWLEIKFTSAETKKVVDISEDISKFFINLDYTDNMSDEADDLTLTLEDRSGLWLNHWLPDDEGNLLDITIHTLNRITLDDGEKTFHLGKFEIDEITCQGMPSIVKIKAVSVIGKGSLRSERKNQSWEKVTLRKVAEDIATRNNLILLFDCDENPEIDHIEQADQADLEFLLKLCKSHGLSLKVTPEQLIIFDEYKYEQKDALITVYNPAFNINDNISEKIILTWLTDWDFRNKTRDTYAKCEVKTQNGKKKETIKGEFADPKGNSEGRTLHINHQVKDEAEAQRLAKKKLREKNKEKTSGRFSTIGNLNLTAGSTIQIKNFGKFDGKYIIDKVNHSISANDFKTSCEIRKCLDGY